MKETRFQRNKLKLLKQNKFHIISNMSNNNQQSKKNHQSISLPFINIKNLNLDLYEKDFTFVIDGYEAKTSKFIADLISPLISKIHRTDPTFESYVINTNNKKITDDYFKTRNRMDFNGQYDFSKMVNMIFDIVSNEEMKSEENSENDIKLIEEILLQLQNDDFYKINSLFNEEINNFNVFSRIQLKIKNDEYDINSISDEIDYISRNFYRFEEEKIFQLNLPIIEAIVSNKNLVISSEDSLLEFIFNILHLEESNFDNNEDRIQFIHSLFEHVEFIHISEERICKFIDEFNIQYLTIGTWRSICERFSSKINKNSKKRKSLRHHKDHIQISDKNENFEDHEMQGIIAYLSQKYKSPFDEGVVNVSSSSVYNDNHSPINVTKPDENSYYLSNDEPNQWIMYDFLQNEIILHSYLLRSTSGWGSDEENISNWVVEVSNDGENWFEIDRHENFQELKGQNITKTFTVQKSTRCKCVRIRQIGKNTYNRTYLALSQFEIFGEII